MFSESVKSVLWILGLISLAAGLVACNGPATAAASESTSGGITVVGQGSANGQPDIAQIQAGVEVFADTVSSAAGQNDAIFQQIMAVLNELGIETKDIQTSNYSVWADQNYGDNGPEGIAGYRVSNMVNINIRDINRVGEVLTAVTEAGANNIYGVRFSVSDPAALEDEARAEAMADARSRAKSLAELSGVHLGDVQMITEVIGQPAPMPQRFGDGAVMETAANIPGISPGELSTQVQIQVTFAIR